MAATTTTAAYAPAVVDSRHLAAYGVAAIPDSHGGYSVAQDSPYAYNFRDRDRDLHHQQQQQQAYPSYADSVSAPRDREGLDVVPQMVRSSSYGEYSNEKVPTSPGFDPTVRPSPLNMNDQDAALHAPYEHTRSSSAADPNDRRRYAPSSPYLRDTFRQSKDDSGIFTDVRSAADTPVDVVSESSATPGGRQSQHLQNGMPKHPNISPSNVNGNVPPRHQQIISSSSTPSYKPAAIPISTNTRAVAQQPTYITPPSSPTPIAVNPVYTYAADPASRYPQQSYRPSGYQQPPDGREICVECAMRDQDMADVDVTSPGVWDRESDIYYHELCRLEMEEAEERARAQASNSSSDSQHVAVRPIDPNRPRARGQRLTEANLKLWGSMNPREPHARHQTIDLYVKTQTALLEAEALARARAMQESRLLESKLKDTYDSLRRTTHDPSNGGTAVDENGVRLKPSHGQKRSVSGPSPLPLGSIVVDGAVQHSRHGSQGREVTLLENGMIVEQVDVRKEERERRREEKRERERERSRARKSSRGSGGDRNGEVMSMYSSPSPLPDSGFYTAASNGSGPMLARDRERPMSLSQSSTRAMSVLTASQPLTPPPGSAPGSVRPPNTRVHSQISLVDSQSISSGSMNAANRRSKFFAFRNWSEAWKSRDSFAPSGVMSLSGSMMDMHLALDREKQAMHARPTTVDLGSNAPSLRHSQIFPRRASVSVDRDVPSRGIERPKKKKGLAKIWGMVRGNRHSKIEPQRGREAPVIDRSEDDTPLAPPPPLSYLVNRTPRERSMSNASRRMSVPSGPSAPPPSGTLPTPTSIRNTWLEDGSRPIGGVLSAHTEESQSYANGNVNADFEPQMSVQPYVSESEVRQPSQDIPPEQRIPTIRTPSSPRPISVYSLHKSLPPLPNEAQATQTQSQMQTQTQSMPTPVSDSSRPVTMFDMKPQSFNSTDNPDVLGAPQPYFRRDVRRQSFGGMTSRPDLTPSGTFPLSGRGMAPRSGMMCPQDPYAYSPYAEMGTTPMVASRSTGKLGLVAAEDAIRCDSDKALGKRRSRFGLSSLLEKMKGGSRGSMSVNVNGNVNASEMRLSVTAPPAPGAPASDSDAHQDGSPSITEYGVGGAGGSSRSRHNGYAGTGGAPSRISVASRRAIEELVDQDPKFVAYRYPSVDQNIALLR